MTSMPQILHAVALLAVMSCAYGEAPYVDSGDNDDIQSLTSSHIVSFERYSANVEDKEQQLHEKTIFLRDEYKNTITRISDEGEAEITMTANRARESKNTKCDAPNVDEMKGILNGVTSDMRNCINDRVDNWINMASNLTKNLIIKIAQLGTFLGDREKCKISDEKIGSGRICLEKVKNETVERTMIIDTMLSDLHDRGENEKIISHLNTCADANNYFPELDVLMSQLKKVRDCIDRGTA